MHAPTRTETKGTTEREPPMPALATPESSEPKGPPPSEHARARHRFDRERFPSRDNG